jgi:hypothetical protein
MTDIEATIAELNGNFTSIRITATPRQIERLRTVGTATNWQVIYGYPDVTPLHFAELTEKGSVNFNHPSSPLSLKRNQSYSLQDVSSSKIWEEIDTATRLLLGRPSFNSVDVDFRDTFFARSQRHTSGFHVDGYSPYSNGFDRVWHSRPIGYYLMAIVNGADGLLNTVAVTGRHRLLLEKLDRIKGRHGNDWTAINRDFEKQLKRLGCTTVQFADNSVTLMFQSLDPHRGSVNLHGPRDRALPRSFARLSGYR